MRLIEEFEVTVNRLRAISWMVFSLAYFELIILLEAVFSIAIMINIISSTTKSFCICIKQSLQTINVKFYECVIECPNTLILSTKSMLYQNLTTINCEKISNYNWLIQKKVYVNILGLCYSMCGMECW